MALSAALPASSAAFLALSLIALPAAVAASPAASIASPAFSMASLAFSDASVWASLAAPVSVVSSLPESSQAAIKRPVANTRERIFFMVVPVWLVTSVRLAREPFGNMVGNK